MRLTSTVRAGSHNAGGSRSFSVRGDEDQAFRAECAVADGADVSRCAAPRVDDHGRIARAAQRGDDGGDGIVLHPSPTSIARQGRAPSREILD